MTIDFSNVSDSSNDKISLNFEEKENILGNFEKLKIEEKPINQLKLRRQRRQYDPEDTDIAELFPAIRKHKIGNPPVDKIQEIKGLLLQIRNINDVDANDNNNTPIHVAVSKGHQDIVELLLGVTSININIKNSDGNTPLHIAAKKGNKDVVDLLITKNADVNIQNDRGKKPLDLANELGNSNLNKQNIITQLNQALLAQPGSSGVHTNPAARVHETHQARGLKDSLHGSIYQLKLLMLFLKRGLDKGYDFRLATEWDAAEKFDDLVFKYTDAQGQVKYRFLQAKHKQDESKKISVNDLLTEKDEEFSLQKYFISYRKIKHNKHVENGVLEDFIIATNIDLRNNIKSNFEQMQNQDNLVDAHIDGKDSVRYKFSSSDNDLKTKLTPIFKGTSDLNILAKELAQHVIEAKPINFKNPILKSYHGALKQENIIDIEKRELHNNFIDDNSLSPLAKKFREFFQTEVAKIKKLPTTDPNLWNEVRNKKLNLSKTFGEIFQLDGNPQITDTEEFAKEIAELITPPDIKVKIEKRKDIIKNNIKRLAGHILISEGEGEDKKIKFSSAFLDAADTSLPGNLQDFKNKLKAKLSSKNINFNQLDQYEFTINNFKTCEDGQQHLTKTLPNDVVTDAEIEEFFQKFTFAVNQPNEAELSNIIGREIGQEFNLIDADLITDNIQRKVLDWVKEKGLKGKEGRFLSQQDCKEFFEEVKRKIATLVMIGPTSQYSKKLKEYNVEFISDKLKEVKTFLDQNSQQILNLVATQETRLSAIKVNQAFKNNDAYKAKDSYIFIPLSKLMRLQDYVLKSFKAKETGNLLVIECKNGAGNIQSLYSELKTTINNNSNKKIILITKQGDSLANEFKNDGAISRKYYKKSDDIGGLSDLTGSSQQKVLDKTVNFQGNNMLLGNVVGVDQREIIDEEVLLRLIDGEKIKIGNEVPIVKTDYIERKFIKNGDENVDTINDKIAVITTEPGGGKSSTLAHLMRKMQRNNLSLWVVKINLIEHIQVLNTENFDNYDKEKAIDFLSKIIGLNSPLEKALFRNGFDNPNKIALFFDGFNEVQKDKVINLLNALKSTEIKRLLVTTDMNMSDSLKDRLQAPVYTLSPFSREEKTQLLQNFLKNNFELNGSDVDQERLKSYSRSNQLSFRRELH